MEVTQKMSPVVEENTEAKSTVCGSRAGEATINKLESHAAWLDGNPSNSSSPEQKNSTINKHDDKLESTIAEMGAVRLENERLKMTLDRIMKDYHSLETLLFGLAKQEHDKKPMENTDTYQETGESELVSLSLGTSLRGLTKEERVAKSTRTGEDEQMKEGLCLGLDRKFDGSGGSSEAQSNSIHEKISEEPRELDEAGKAWPPSKLLKTLRDGEDEASQQTHFKKARVSVRARCDAPMMIDGCHWRKYGQKVSKGNPCPRGYYRCTVAAGCPVRKQVQRCVEDMSILITTYEGTHNHPLPMSATAMASTTSAAACMLMSGSSASPPAIGAATMATSATATSSSGLHGLSFNLSDHSRQRQLHRPNPSITSSPSYTAITLDLTSPSASFPSTQFNSLSSNFPTTSYSLANFSFSSSQANPNPTSWSSGYPTYETQTSFDNKNQHVSFASLGGQLQGPLYQQSYLQKNTTTSAAPVHDQNSLTGTIAAATEAIATDPSFQSALSAAITSVIGGQRSQGAAETTLQSRRWREVFSPASPFTSSPGGNGCGSGSLTGSTFSSLHMQRGDLKFLQPLLASSVSESASASPVDDRERK